MLFRSNLQRISVADRGMGINEEFREKIFSPLQRLNARSKFPGTGMGLAIVRKNLDLLGGKIWMEERDGGGSVFHFTLPAA